jgi:hypothetical protein
MTTGDVEVLMAPAPGRIGGSPVMNKRILLSLAVVFMAALGVSLGLLGCAEKDLGGVEIPNVSPDTRVTGEPPTLLESGFIIHFEWTGSDPDGRVKGFQWRVSDNGIDGISPQDTLTYDPATGDTLNPWFFTTATETTIIVSADLAGFPGDEDLPPGASDRDHRNWQTHTFFVRAVDMDGMVDNTPAFLSFTATTLVPYVKVDRPAYSETYGEAQQAPPTVTFGYTGTDPDFPEGSNRPIKVRWLFKRAWTGTGYLNSRYSFENMDPEDLVSWADSGWSEWHRYSDDPKERIVRFEDQPAVDESGRRIYYIFVLQAMDTTGAVSVDRVYGRSVHNVLISNLIRPALYMREKYLGTRDYSGVGASSPIDIAQGQQLEFSWSANADHYAGVIESYRYGWDLLDPDDENDPNWAVPPGNSPLHRLSAPRSFNTGTHRLTVQVTDNSDQITRYSWVLVVVPVPDYYDQAPLLLIDDCPDQQSQAWPDQLGRARGNDRYRDAFWQDTLGGSGGVAQWTPSDVVDTWDVNLRYRDIVDYKVVVYTTYYAQQNFVWQTFKPEVSGDDKFIWLESYQQSVGNLFLVGERALNGFIEVTHRGVPWVIPWVFAAAEEFTSFNNVNYATGWGTRELPDGTEILLGKERYPYRSIGVSVLDHAQPQEHVYGIYTALASTAVRSSACVGLKGLALDDSFKVNHMAQGSVFPDTILTNPEIDWKDIAQPTTIRDRLGAFPFATDEIYDRFIVPRSTPWSPQECGDQPCIEPMFRFYSRFDWIDDVHMAVGDTLWPYNLMSHDTVTNQCGRAALDPITGRTRIGNSITGFISHKMEANKPSRKGDVVWGFDPYRFERDAIQNAIHWVLGEHFNLQMSAEE